MPSLDTIRTITIKATTDGVDDATRSLKSLAVAQDNVAVVSETSSRSTLSAQASLDRLKRQVDTNYASQQQFAKGETTLQKAMNQGLLTTAEYAKVHGQLTDKFEASKVPVGKMAEVMAVMESRAVGASASLGLVGTVLQIVGPAGLVVGAVIGAGAVAMHTMAEEATRLAEKAKGLQEFADNVGLTATQVQGLQVAGATVGLSSEQVATSITRLTASMDELRQGTGSALAQIRRLDPDLADQLATVSDTSKAVDLLASAWEKADTFQRNALAKSLFGKGGASSGQLLGEIGDAGGLQAYIAAQSKSITLTDDQTKHLADLKTEIDASGSRIRDTIAGWFSSSVLENQKQARSEMEGILKAVKEWSQSTAPSWWEKLKDFSRSSVAGQTGGSLSPNFRVNEVFQVTNDHPLLPFAPGGGSVPLPGSRPAGAPTAAPTAAYILSTQQQQASILGGAATSTEALALKTAQLNAENEKAGGIYGNLVARAKTYYQVQQNGADLLIKVQNAAATETELYAQRQAELQELVKKGTLTQDQANASLEIYANKGLKDTIDQMEVLKSKLPQLKQLELDAGNATKQLDGFATTSLNAVSPALQDMLNGTTTLSGGFQNLGLTAVKALENMIIQLMIIKPLAASMGLAGNSLLGALGIGTGTVANGGIVLGNASGPGVFANAHGNAFDGSNIVPFARGGIVDRPTMFRFASGTGLMGEAGPEAIVPLKRGADGNLGIAGGGGGRMPQITVILNETATGGGATSQKQNASGGFDIEVAIAQISAKSAATPGAPLNRVLTDQLGGRQRLASR